MTNEQDFNILDY